MANVAEEAVWEDGIYQLETTDEVMGGENGIDNLQAKQLANRTKWLKDNICPIGVPLPWPTDTAPDGFAIMKGQEFDTEIYTKLAEVFTDGVIPDMRGLAIVGKDDDETILDYEDDGVISHSHSASTASTDLGTKYTATDSHSHTFNSKDSTKSVTDDGTSQTNVASNIGSSNNTDSNSHSHSITMGSHTHTVTVDSTGNDENTIKNRKFNWIVRMS